MRNNDKDTVERTSVSLPASTARKLRYQAEAEARTVSSVVRDAVEAYVTKAEKRQVPLPSFVAAGSGDGSTVADGRDEKELAKALDREHQATTGGHSKKRAQRGVTVANLTGGTRAWHAWERRR